MKLTTILTLGALFASIAFSGQSFQFSGVQNQANVLSGRSPIVTLLFAVKDSLYNFLSWAAMLVTIVGGSIVTFLAVVTLAGMVLSIISGVFFILLSIVQGQRITGKSLLDKMFGGIRENLR